MSEIAELIERLEKATGPDGSLDLDIRFYLDGVRSVGGYWAENIATGERVRVDYTSPNYTASIDAALTLVPEGHYWHAAHGKTRDDEPLGGASIIESGTLATISEGEAPTAAIALCIAALRARAALATQPPSGNK